MPNKIQEIEAKSPKSKIAIVTGATRGIGRAIAERLLNDGMRVAICGRLQNSVDEALRELSSQGDVFGFAADVTQLDQVRNFVAATERHFGGVDTLVNNAGSGTFRSVADLSPEEWNQTIALNLSGVYYCCHEVLPILRKQGNGDVINISSLAGKNAFAGGAAYNASKFGLNGFSEAMMLDHRNEGIRVSYIMPGSVDTEFGSGGGSGRSGPQESDSERLKSDSERLKNAWKIAPSDVADVVALILAMPRRTTVSRVEIRPSMPPGKS